MSQTLEFQELNLDELQRESAADRLRAYSVETLVLYQEDLQFATQEAGQSADSYEWASQMLEKYGETCPNPSFYRDYANRAAARLLYWLDRIDEINEQLNKWELENGC